MWGKRNKERQAQEKVTMAAMKNRLVTVLGTEPDRCSGDGSTDAAQSYGAATIQVPPAQITQQPPPVDAVPKPSDHHGSATPVEGSACKPNAQKETIHPVLKLANAQSVPESAQTFATAPAPEDSTVPTDPADLEHKSKTLHLLKREHASSWHASSGPATSESRDHQHPAFRKAGPSTNAVMAHAPSQPRSAIDVMHQGIHVVSEGSAPDLEEATQRQLRLFEESLTRIANKVVSQAQGSMHRSVARLEGSLAQVEEMNSAIDASFTEFNRKTAEAARSQSENFTEHLARICQQAISQAQARFESGVAESEQNAAHSFEQAMESLASRLQDSQAHCETLAAKVEELRHQCASELEQIEPRIREFSRQTIESGMQVVKGKAAEELEAYALSAAEQARERIQAEVSAATDELIEGAYRTRLQATLREFHERTSQELSAEIQKVYAEGRQAALAQLQKESQELGRQTSDQIRSSCQDSLHKALEEMQGRISEAGDPLKQREEKIVERLEAQIEERFTAFSEKQLTTFGKQAEDVPAALLSQLRADSEAIGHSLCERVKSDIQLMETRVLEALQGKLQRVAEELAQSSTSRLREVSERNLTVAKTAMARVERQMMAEAPRLLRDKIGEALTALQRNFGKVAEDSEEAESLEAPERMLSLLSPGPFASYEDDALKRAEGEFEAGGEASIAAKPW